MGRHYKLGTTSWTTVGTIAAALSGASWCAAIIASLLSMTYVLICLAVPLGLMAWPLAIGGLICGIVARQQKDRYAWVGITLAVMFIVVNIVSLLVSGILIGLMVFEDVTALSEHSTVARHLEEVPFLHLLAVGYFLPNHRCVDDGYDPDPEHDWQ